MEPRRGFEELVNSELTLQHTIKGTNFFVSGTERPMGLTTEGKWRYYTGTLPSPYPELPGYSDNILPPDSVNGKSRFVRAGQNMYLTAQDGVRSLSSGTSAQVIRAGVPKGLNLEAATNGDLSGFFTNNEVLSTTGDLSSGSAIISNLDDTTGVEIDMYVGGTNIPVGTKVTAINESASSIVTGKELRC